MGIIDRMRERERALVREEVVQSLPPCSPGSNCCPDEDDNSSRDLAAMTTRHDRLSLALARRRGDA